MSFKKGDRVRIINHAFDGHVGTVIVGTDGTGGAIVALDVPRQVRPADHVLTNTDLQVTTTMVGQKQMERM